MTKHITISSAPTATTAYRGILVLTKDLLVDLGDGDYTATVGTLFGLLRDDGTPNQAGDVLSVQPGGEWQTRPAGTTGAFERAKLVAAGLVYRPKGPEAPTYLVPLVTVWPNE